MMMQIYVPKLRTIKAILVCSCLIAIVIFLFNGQRTSVTIHNASLKSATFETTSEGIKQRTSKHLLSLDEHDGCYFRIVQPKAQENSDVIEKRDIGFMDAKYVAVCVPAKVSSTSFWGSVYWAYTNRTANFASCKKNKFVQDLDECGWESYIEMPAGWITNVRQLTTYEQDGLFAFAIARDPIQRIISAYKSKVACDAQGFGTDKAGRRKIVRQLLDQVGRNDDNYRICIRSFVEFVDLIFQVFQKPGVYLNPHFASQNGKCRYDMIRYDAIVPLEQLDEALMFELSKALQTPIEIRPFHSHSSKVGSNVTLNPPDNVENLSLSVLEKLYMIYEDDMKNNTLGGLYHIRDKNADIGMISDIITLAPP